MNEIHEKLIRKIREIEEDFDSKLPLKLTEKITLKSFGKVIIPSLNLTNSNTNRSLPL